MFRYRVCKSVTRQPNRHALPVASDASSGGRSFLRPASHRAAHARQRFSGPIAPTWAAGERAVVSDLLGRAFEAEAPNQKVVG